jgi:hypothetical protein
MVVATFSVFVEKREKRKREREEKKKRLVTKQEMIENRGTCDHSPDRTRRRKTKKKKTGRRRPKLWLH